MQNDLFCYKSRFLTFSLLLGYAYLHTKLTGVYVDASLNQMFELTARLPFGQRILVPSLARLLSHLLPISVDHLFFLMEWLFISLTYFVLVTLFTLEFTKRQSKMFSWLFILLLPLMSVINYRYTVMGEATFFYPSDTATLFFMLAGFVLCLREKWFIFILLVFVATFNRESSLLLILMIPALHWQSKKNILKPTMLAFIAYVLARLIVFKIIDGVPGHVLEWYFSRSHYTHFNINLVWLLNEQHLLMFPFCFAGLPLFWFVFYDYIPTLYRPLKYVALFSFLVVLLVGNFMEARVFSEILILLYLPVCIAITRWITGQAAYSTDSPGILYYLDRYAILGVLALIVICRNFLDPYVIWLSHHSP